MKKSLGGLFVFIILLALGGTAFFFGWAQFAVPPGSFGVMRSKTHGIDPDVIREGKFRWVWYKLIPTNVVISIFSPNTVEQSVRLSGSLPMGDVYRSFAGLNTDFSWEIGGSFSFNVKADSFPALMADRGITDQRDLETLERSMGREIETFIQQKMGAYAENQENSKQVSSNQVSVEDILKNNPGDRLRSDILAAYPDIENLYVSITTVKYPDFALYTAAGQLYKGYFDRQMQLLTADAAAAADRHIGIQGRLDELAQYGELLTKYPILLQYLGIENKLPSR
ncbi:hypothetical protein AGMMS49991_00840 [Spirochaetia bacterium]|nr:hypothetical protein AGMMS49991_00840 [Spirochaetia bacterium]